VFKIFLNVLQNLAKFSVEQKTDK